MTRPALFVAVTALLASFLAIAGALIARVQDESVNVWLSMGTALVIGTFLAFLILAPRAAKEEEPAAEGFAVIAQEETRPVMVPRDDAPAPQARPEDRAPEGSAEPAADDPRTQP